MNDAAIDFWVKVDQAVDGPLRDLVRHSLGDDSYLDAWVDRLVQNGLDTMPTDDVVGVDPIRRIGLRDRD